MSAYALDRQTGGMGAVSYTAAEVERIQNLHIAVMLGMRLSEVEEMPDFEREEFLAFIQVMRK